MSTNALATDLEPDVPQEEIEKAAKETPTDAPQEQPVVENKEKTEEQKTVPHGAFHEERERRKALQEQLRKEQTERAVLADRLNQLYAASQQQPRQPQFIDPRTVENPVEAIQHNQQLTLAQVQELRTSADQEAQRRMQVEQENRFVSHVNNLEAEFSSQQPDYADALNFVRDRRVNELKALGYPPDQVMAIVHQNAQMLAADAIRVGRNPAEAIYRMAQSTGYKPKSQAADQKIETLQKGQQAAKNLGGSGGSGGMPTPEQIAAMSEDDFAEFKAVLSKKGKTLSDVL